MNDETPDAPEEGSMIYMNLPPEVRQMIEHSKMHAEENAHTVLRFLNSLDEDQLRAFRGILSGVVAVEDSVPYYMGLVGGILHEKYGVCLGCGLKHDDELKDMAGEGPFPFDVETEAKKADDELKNTSGGEFESYSLEQFAIDCENYAVEPFIENDVDTMVLCSGPCKTKGGERGKWFNIHERMERKAGTGGCDFCVSIQKWG